MADQLDHIVISDHRGDDEPDLYGRFATLEGTERLQSRDYIAELKRHAAEQDPDPETVRGIPEWLQR